MILTCPSCATSYFTPDDAIGPGGRTVRCQSCAQTWRAVPDEPLELTVATATGPATEERSFGKRDETPETLAETPAAELPGAFRARAEQQRRLRRAAAHGAVWAGMASVFLALLGCAWLFRVEVVDMAPRTASAYAAVGLKVNPTGLEFEALSGKALPNDPGKVVISGALRNVRDNEVVAPPVRVALLDAHGAEIGHAVIEIDAAPVLPGKVQGFAVVIADPGAKGVDVAADFAPRAPARARPAEIEDHAAAPPAAQRAAHRPPPGSAPITGLRPAMAPLEPASSNMTPVDARPIPTALDSGPAEALSPSHGEH